MTATLPPPARPAPPPPKPAGGTSSVRTATEFKIETGVKRGSQKVVVYSGGGAGKTSLAEALAKVGVKALVIDLERGSYHCDVSRVDTVQTWDQLRALLASPLIDGFDALFLDSLTKAEELAVAWTLANVPHEKGHNVTSVEGYGWGKGVGHVYDTFCQLLHDLDAIVRRGKHVVCTAHECTANVPNPNGDDWIRYEPRLQAPKQGKDSIRLRVKEWCDHLLFIGYDVWSKDGKAKGSGTRTIYTTEQPTHMAKSRTLRDSIPYPLGSSEVWKQLLTGGN